MDEMTITNAKYIELEPGVNISVNATVNGTEMSIPINTSNRHYQAILDWVADGNTIQDAS